MFPLLFLIEALTCSVLAVDFKIDDSLAAENVLIAEKQQPEVSGWFGDALQDIESKSSGLKLKGDTIFLDREEEEESYAKLCASLSKGASVVFDTVWAPWTQFDGLISSNPLLPLIKSAFGECASTLDAVLQLLQTRKATDAVFIFKNEQELDQALYNILGKSTLRILAMEGVHRKIGDMRPAPGNIIIIGKTEFIQETYKQAVEMDLVKLPDRWILASTDLSFFRLDPSVLVEPACLIGYGPSFSCRLQGIPSPCNHDETVPIGAVVMNKMIEILSDALMEVNQKTTKIDCNLESPPEDDQRFQNPLYKVLEDKISSKDSLLFWDKLRRGLFLRADYIVKTGGPKGLRTAAEWITTNNQLIQVNSTEIKTPRRFFRVGTTPAIPWTYPKIDSSTGKEMLNIKGEPIYEGYCMDLVKKLSEQMDFDYEIVTPKTGTFGVKHKNGSWDGLIGDLQRGDTDIAVAATIMTSQREEAVDFVAPYFEQTGILIAIRKPISKTSLFKFMTVLRVEVWLSILAALILTAGLLALLDKYSPYSARNNKKDYPYPCREFTLKESFWFALTSFTPQGGGEAPKALSGRALVAAYWLFVVLMLATFTANLAAFLTVERMQTPVSSLEQLARQSRINYTVVKGHIAHQYFINMKHAEDTLYRVWKEITLNSSADESIYQVWDYPIREQYGHILLAINSSEPLPNAEVAFKKVNENEQADFAFIHDSSEIKYEVSRNCNLTIVGEVFGERPYAIAVQQGSRLQEELSKAVLELQKQRFLEGLTAKYWNRTCDDGDESEGITLDSLGGIFIATLFGLALAMLTLAWEVFYYKRKERKNKIKSQDTDPKAKVTTGWGPRIKATDKLSMDYKLTGKHRNVVTIGESFRPAIEKQKPKVSYINVDPKSRWNP